MNFTEKDIDNCKKIFSKLSEKKFNKLLKKQDDLKLSSNLRSTLQKLKQNGGSYDMIAGIGGGNKLNLKENPIFQKGYEDALKESPMYKEGYKQAQRDISFEENPVEEQQQYEENPVEEEQQYEENPVEEEQQYEEIPVEEEQQYEQYPVNEDQLEEGPVQEETYSLQYQPVQQQMYMQQPMYVQQPVQQPIYIQQ